MRTSTFTGLRPPTASTAPSCSARSSFTCAASGSSPTSSRNSVPPEASTNLPMWRSVAPVKAPFSWPNRIDSTRLSGIAPQLTATNGFALRSPLPWMARANNSLPTPDSPSISTGMVEAAAFCAVRSTPRHGFAAGDDVGEGQPAFAAVADALQFALQRAGVERIAQRHLQPLEADRLDHEILGAGAHRRHHIVDAAMGGLHDHGDVEAGFADLGQHAHAVEAGHHEIEHHGVDRRRVGGGQQRRSRRRRNRRRRSHSRISAPCFRPAGAAPHRRRRSKWWQPWLSPHVTTICLEFGALSPMPINALLNLAVPRCFRRHCLND